MASYTGRAVVSGRWRSAETRVRPVSATSEVRRHRPGHQFELPRLIAQRPQVDALAAGLGITREELGAVPRRTDADLRAKLVGISSQNWSQDVGEHAITLRPILRYPGPHRRERVGKAVGFPPVVRERTLQGTAGVGEPLRRRVVRGRKPAVTRPRD